MDPEESPTAAEARSAAGEPPRIRDSGDNHDLELPTETKTRPAVKKKTPRRPTAAVDAQVGRSMPVVVQETFVPVVRHVPPRFDSFGWGLVVGVLSLMISAAVGFGVPIVAFAIGLLAVIAIGFAYTIWRDRRDLRFAQELNRRR